MQFVDDLLKPQFNSRVTCGAAMIDPVWLKNWVLKESPAVVLSAEERTLAGSKNRFLFSLSRVLHFATMADLVFSGFSPRKAHLIAQGFTYSESNPSFPFSAERAPAAVFETGLSLLVAKTHDEVGRMYRIDTNECLALAMQQIWMTNAGVHLVNISALNTRVRAYLADVSDREEV